MSDYSKVNHPGGGELVSEGSATNFFEAFNDRVSDHKARGQADLTGMLAVGSSIDRQRRVPTWMSSSESFAIDGSRLTEEAKEASYLGRYKNEFEVGAAITAARRQARSEYTNTLVGQWRSARRKLGLEAPLTTDAREIEKGVRQRWEEEVGKMEALHKSGGVHSDRQLSWGSLMEDIAERKPLSKIHASYRPRVDVYGIDTLLDNGGSVILGSTKYSAMIGSVIGGVRGSRGLVAEMGTVLSSGISFVVMANFIMLATALKYSIFAFVASTGFVVGDRAARYAKLLTFRERQLAEKRSTSNYVAGFACSLAPIGFTPYWFFSDARLGLRYAATGAFVGGLTGLLVSRVVDRLSSVNLQRINATDRQLRRYEALMRRQQTWCDLESQRRKELVGKGAVFDTS